MTGLVNVSPRHPLSVLIMDLEVRPSGRAAEGRRPIIPDNTLYD